LPDQLGWYGRPAKLLLAKEVDMLHYSRTMSAEEVHTLGYRVTVDLLRDEAREEFYEFVVQASMPAQRFQVERPFEVQKPRKWYRKVLRFLRIPFRGGIEGTQIEYEMITIPEEILTGIAAQMDFLEKEGKQPTKLLLSLDSWAELRKKSNQNLDAWRWIGKNPNTFFGLEVCVNPFIEGRLFLVV
jgi:hypothetical protein